jgi:hypothetical protein
LPGRDGGNSPLPVQPAARRHPKMKRSGHLPIQRTAAPIPTAITAVIYAD